MRGINIEKSYLIHISEASITPLTVYFMRTWVIAPLRPKHCANSSHGTQEQGKPFSPITEKVARPDPSSTSAGSVRENSSETVLSEEGRTQKFIPWKKHHTQV